MKKALIFIEFLLFLSCGFQYQSGTNLSPKTNHFNAPKKEVRITTEISVDSNDLKSLLVVQYDKDLEIANNLNFFDEVMTRDQFEDAIIKSGYADEIKSIRDNKGLHIAATLFRSFVVLNHYYGERSSIEGFRLYDPKTESIIFENEMNIGVLSMPVGDQRRYFPLYNSLLDYLRKQK
jgi:hypothetical protein